MSTQGYVLDPTGGEHLIRNDGNVYLIKVDPSRGSNNMALGTQKVPMRTGILVHQHQEADEVLFVLEGTGFGLLVASALGVPPRQLTREQLKEIAQEHGIQLK